MVVRGDREGLDASVHQELGQNRLELGLAGLEIVTSDEGVVALSKLDDSRNKGVLGSTIDEWLAFEDGGDGEEGGGRNLGVRRLDSCEDIIGSIVDSGNDVAVTLSVGSPENNNAVKVVLLFEVADVGSDMLEVRLLVGTWNKIVSAGLLVGSDEVGIVNGGEGLLKLRHVRGDLALEVIVQDRRASSPGPWRDQRYPIHRGRDHWDEPWEAHRQ
jgi:hypothetical protein